VSRKDYKFLVVLIILTILNTVDALATAFWIEHRLATEANPLMEYWLNISPSLFIGIKIVLVTICSYFLWKLRKRKLTYILLIPVILVYTYIFAKHANIAWTVFS
jgi:hypothetical protein